MLATKLKFYLQLAAMEPGKMSAGEVDMFLNIARDGDVIRVIKDQLLREQAEGNDLSLPS